MRALNNCKVEERAALLLIDIRIAASRIGSKERFNREYTLRERATRQDRPDLPVGLIFRNRVNPLKGKDFSFPEVKIRRMVRTVPSPQEGRYAIVTSVGRGMRWTLWHARRSVLEADGKSAWS
jgi:hypothetical protein